MDGLSKNKNLFLSIPSLYTGGAELICELIFLKFLQ